MGKEKLMGKGNDHGRTPLRVHPALAESSMVVRWRSGRGCINATVVSKMGMHCGLFKGTASEMFRGSRKTPSPTGEAMTASAAPPEGFAPHTRGSPVTAPWEPLYSRQAASGAVEIGLHVREAHCNGRGFLHGGVIAALADNAMGLSYAHHVGGAGSVVTLNLSVDYLAVGKLGDWLVIEPRVVRAGRNVGFVDALVRAGEKPIARASAIFNCLAHG